VIALKMLPFKLVLALALVLSVEIGVPPTRAQQVDARVHEPRSGDGGTIKPGEVVVEVRRDGRAPAVAQRARAAMGKEVGPRVRQLTVAPGDERAAAARLRGDPDVVAASPNYVRHAQVIPSDPLFPQQWWLSRIEAPAAWDVTRGDSSIVIAILDSGVDPDHPDLTGKLLDGVSKLSTDPTNPSTCPANTTVRDDYDHGTHVTGIAAARTDNGVGVAGVGWAPMVLPVKVLDCHGDGSDDDVIAGIDYAISRGVRVINLSFGGPGQSDVLDAAIARAWQAGIVVTAASGNGRTDEPYYPAASPHAIAVTATDQSDRFATTYSNFGSYVSVAAPGSDILSTLPTYRSSTNPYAVKTGTSMSSPQVAGLAALLWSEHPTYPVNRIIGLIYISADRLSGCPTGISCAYDESGRNNYYGHGRINAARAVRIADTMFAPLVFLRAGFSSR
jgi:subtilisin family serine protease